MVSLASQFNGIDDNAISASTGVPEALPAGTYRLNAVAFELAATKSGNGKILKATLDVCEGAFEGRKIFPNYNIQNSNVQAQNIGIGELKALALACGVPWELAREDTDHLLHKPFMAVVGFEKPSVNAATGEAYAPRNQVKKYIPFGEQPVAGVAPISLVAATHATPQAGNPWDKKAPF